MKKKKSALTKKGETSAERGAGEAQEKQHEHQVERPGAPADGQDNLEIDVSAAPDLLTFEENNIWAAEQLGEKYVQECGRWELFQRSQNLAGFAEARASWATAWTQYLRSHGDVEASSGPIDIEKCFFRQFRHDPEGALRSYAFLVSDAAARGDMSFFDKMSGGEKRRRARRPREDPISFVMLHNWLHGFLWLMSAKWGSSCLERWSGRSVSEDNYSKIGQRLNLRGWETAHDHPLIEGYNPSTGAFTFRTRWTDLIQECPKV